MQSQKVLMLMVCSIFLQVYVSIALPADTLFLGRKTIQAVRIAEIPKIDGQLDDPCWKLLPAAQDFVEYSPYNGKNAPFPTQVRFGYDDVALYIGAMMYDPYPDSICREIGKRDQIELLNTDYISFDILPYNDAINMYEFKVGPTGIQSDTKYSAVGQDVSWDAVWETATVITDSGWIAEVRIPFSALRFPAVEKQEWGFNLWRNLHRRNEWSTWCFVDINDRELFNYYGVLAGMDDIHPPVRLSFMPYVSGYLEKSPERGDWKYSFRGGMDLKYGINESYTLDMILIPDFGQVQSDDKILNLTPFEVKYDERRQFFTEGTEMFNKCGIFYTRRVGAMPRNFFRPYDSLRQNEVIYKNPEETRIINATKISGRNADGLGIGFFNAITSRAKSIIEDTLTGTKRNITTQPFTNYNVLVLDQNLKNNSYLSLVNTNLWIPGDAYSANVTGIETKISNKKSTVAVFGNLNISQKYDENSMPVFGHSLLMNISKPSGKFRYLLQRQQIDGRYDPNDMGFLLNNNEISNELRLSYFNYDPFWKILNSQSTLYLQYVTLYKPSDFTTLWLGLDNYTTYRNFWVSYLQLGLNPHGYHDHFEPRMWGWTYKRPSSYDLEIRIATDTRKKFRLHLITWFQGRPADDNFHYRIVLTPRFRFNDRLTMTFNAEYNRNNNDFGWVNTEFDSLVQPSIYFGRRDVTIVNNVISASYTFSIKASLTLRVRHYWSFAEYHDFRLLGKDGHLHATAYNQQHNLNFNAFTADLQFVWYFAPGSELSVVWKNLITTLGDQIDKRYFTDLKNTLDSPQYNGLSVRLLYYLDYHNVKRLFSSSKGKKKNS